MCHEGGFLVARIVLVVLRVVRVGILIVWVVLVVLGVVRGIFWS